MDEDFIYFFPWGKYPISVYLTGIKYDALTGMDEGKTSFERLLSVMPEGW
jgi:hypothetical protein